MKNYSPKLPALLVCSLFFSGCVAVSDLKNGSQSIAETTCANASASFSTSGALETGILVSALPSGNYGAVSAEVYFDRTDRGSKVQYLETPGATSGVWNTSLRCRELESDFASYTSNVLMISSFKKYNSGDFDWKLLSHALNEQSNTASSLRVSLAAEARSSTASTVATSIATVWNAGYQFVRRSGDLYEFHGSRIAGGETIRGKATFVRVALPANSP